MGAKIRIELDHDGFKQLLESPEVGDLVAAYGAQMAKKAGKGFVSHMDKGGFGGGRNVAFVGTGTKAAKRAQAKDKALSKALHSMG